MHREARLSGESDRRKTERAGRDFKHFWRIASDGLLENRQDYRKNRVLYFRRCPVRGGNPTILVQTQIENPDANFLRRTIKASRACRWLATNEYAPSTSTSPETVAPLGWLHWLSFLHIAK